MEAKLFADLHRVGEEMAADTKAGAAADLPPATADGWTCIFSVDRFVVPVESIPDLADKATQVWVRSKKDPSYGAKSKPNEYPIDNLRNGKSMSNGEGQGTR